MCSLSGKKFFSVASVVSCIRNGTSRLRSPGLIRSRGEYTYYTPYALCCTRMPNLSYSFRIVNNKLYALTVTRRRLRRGLGARAALRVPGTDPPATAGSTSWHTLGPTRGTLPRQLAAGHHLLPLTTLPQVDQNNTLSPRGPSPEKQETCCARQLNIIPPPCAQSDTAPSTRTSLCSP